MWIVRRRLPYLVAVLAVLVVVAPALRSPPSDSFPLSDYPMFTTDRGRRAPIATAVGVAHDGTLVRLSPELIGGTDEVILAGATVSRAVASGGSEPGDLCQEVAERVRASGRDDVARVEVRTELHDVVAFFSDSRDPISVDEHASCEVPGG